jgi:hypothetical protein
MWGFSPEWTDWCVMRSPLSLKAFIHVPHWYGFSPLCVLLWTIRLPRVVKCLLQTGLSCGQSCVWIQWFVRALLHLKVLPHMLHWWGFSWECNVTWHARFDLNLNDLPHIEHWCVCSSEWETQCVIKLDLLLNDLPQILQKWPWRFKHKVLWLHRLDLYLKHFPHTGH